MEKECTEEEMYDDIMKGIAEEEFKYNEEINKIKADFKQQLHGFIDVNNLFEWLDESNDSWEPEDIVEIRPTEEKERDYPSHEFARIINDADSLLYMRNDADFDDVTIDGIDHYYAWQRTGMLGDDYSGWILYPMNDGKYFKVRYSC